MKCLQCFIYKILQLSLHKSNCNSLFKHSNGPIVLLFFCRYALYDFKFFSHTPYITYDIMKMAPKVDEPKMDDCTIVEYVSFGRSPFSNRTVQFRIWSASVEPDCPIRIWTSTFKSDRSVSYLIVQIRIGLSSYERDRLLSNLTVQFRTWSILVETYRPLSNLPVHFRNWSSTIDVSLAIVCCSVWPS